MESAGKREIALAVEGGIEIFTINQTCRNQRPYSSLRVSNSVLDQPTRSERSIGFPVARRKTFRERFSTFSSEKPGERTAE